MHCLPNNPHRINHTMYGLYGRIMFVSGKPSLFVFALLQLKHVACSCGKNRV